MVSTKIYAHINKEAALEKGREIGLHEEALNMFMHFNEIELDIVVDTETGIVVKINAVGP